jgi:hypothetical protein
MADRKYEKYLVTELKAPFSPEAAAAYSKWATRILWLDEDAVKGAFQVNCSWYRKPSGTGGTQAHSHDYDEVIAFFGGDPDKPHDLCGEVAFWLEDEKYILTKSTLIFAPRGMKHGPLEVLRADRPIFHFSVVTGTKYIAKPAN